MANSGWQFPDNNCTNNYGLEDAGTETFAGDSDGGLAREICQNSIDANNKKGKPTRVEFSTFTIKTSDIPGCEQLKKEIEECYEYKGHDEKEGKQLTFIRDTINKDEITCLRISDFNTTGLVGVQDDENDSPFYLLTKGSGTSDKTEGKGGSKGIGKYACFVASDINTVFYSTKAFNEKKNREEIGHIGITKLRSRSMHNPNRPNLMTMGTGYYASNQDNAPFHEELRLDPNFSRKDGEYGTDVYLIGFSSKEWIPNIVYKILEGFMAAIILDGFEAKVGRLDVNKRTLPRIINSDLFKYRSQNERRYIRAMYSLFATEGVNKKEFTIGKDSTVSVYVRSYGQKEAGEASKRCEFIRYPYMRIKKIGIHTHLPYSAMCIIENNELCEKLRNVEDPAHTDWQFDRLKKYGKETLKATKDLYDELEQKVRDYIYDCLQQGTGGKVDFEGASEYLPAEDLGMGEEKPMKSEGTEITPVRKVKPQKPKTKKTSDDEEGPGFDMGNPNGDDDGYKFPGKNPGDPNPNPNPKPPVDDEHKGSSDGDTPAVVRVPLGGMRYKAIINSKNKSIDIIFTSKFDEPECELTLRQVGLNEDRYPVSILSAFINGEPCIVENGIIKNFTIKKEEKYRVSCKIDTDERFASEVVLNAIR